MKIKLLGAVLLSICFALLGLASGGIPVLSADTVPAGLSLTASPEPTATAAPLSSPTPSPAPEATPSPTAEPSSPAPASPEPVPTPEDPWVPDVRVVPTTITWEDPIKNETSYEQDGQSLMDQPPPISLPEDGPQILIIHTHGTEAYTPDGTDQYESSEGWRTDDPAHTVVRVGQALAEALQAQGLRVLHDEQLYDLPSYNGSYANSEAAIRQHLAEHPDIAMVIDLHRDALGDDETVYKTVVSRSDPPVAQIMLVVGTDVNLPHPGWRDNLALAMSLQGLAETAFPGLMRPVLLCPYRYNQQLTAGSLLMEVGTAGNTLQEAIRAVEQFAQAVGPALAARAGA